MKTRNWIWVWILIFLLSCPFEESFSQDPGIPDTVRFGEWSTYLPGPPSQGKAIVPLIVFNDYPLCFLQIVLKYIGPIECDTAYFAQGRPDVCYSKDVYVDTTVSVDGIDGLIVFSAIALPRNGMPSGVGEIGRIHFHVQDTGSVELDTTCWGPICSSFMDTAAYTYVPKVVDSDHYIVPSVPGDVNQSGEVNSADVVFLIDYLFKQGPPPDFLELADVNKDCIVNSADVVYLMNYLFKGGPCPKPGCAS
ncbi:MAG: hypothetical protein AMJ73_04445 [candidate division Zixibacteria bacterium SM1_73]|nr:MAG: hypothetical protein AMJ73_04445 [candidate division Zixibacteria bacterium SM1_73]